MMLMVVVWVLIVLFPASEIALTVLKRSKSRPAGNQDRGSMAMVWVGVAVGVTAAMAAQSVRATHLYVRFPVLELVTLVLMVAGLSIRWWAIVVLGRYFTTNVAVHEQQPVMQSGPYRFVRHPSYVGALLAFAGIGIVMHNWLSILVLLVPVMLALLYRIAVEERALLATLGAPYAEYCRQTKRLIPGIF
jgi:protein-S-isoprenylcysteine O-methyltransferase Ste14